MKTLKEAREFEAIMHRVDLLGGRATPVHVYCEVRWYADIGGIRYELTHDWEIHEMTDEVLRKKPAKKKARRA